MNGPCVNTDRELWREREGDYYADSIHVTEDGCIGINCGGSVIVMPARAWHEAGKTYLHVFAYDGGKSLTTKLPPAIPDGER